MRFLGFFLKYVNTWSDLLGIRKTYVFLKRWTKSSEMLAKKPQFR